MQLAWLEQRPKKSDGKLCPTSRAERIEDDGGDIEYPPVIALHLLHALEELGMAAAGAMGAVPLSWQEIDAWARRTHTPLRPWEARALHRASCAYVRQTYLDGESEPPPYGNPDDMADEDVVAERLEKALLAMSKPL